MPVRFWFRSLMVQQLQRQSSRLKPWEICTGSNPVCTTNVYLIDEVNNFASYADMVQHLTCNQEQIQFESVKKLLFSHSVTVTRQFLELNFLVRIQVGKPWLQCSGNTTTCGVVIDRFEPGQSLYIFLSFNWIGSRTTDSRVQVRVLSGKL